MGVERVIITAGRAVGLAVKDCFDAIFFGSTQKEIAGMEAILAGHITPVHRTAYQRFRLSTVGLHEEPSLVTDGWLISVSGHWEVQDPRAVEIEYKRLEVLTLDELDAEVRGDARSRLIMALTIRGKRPEDIVLILSAITTPPQKS